MILFEKTFAEVQADKKGTKKFCRIGDGKENPSSVLVLYWGKVSAENFAGFCYNIPENIERLKKAGYNF